ncbi:MerR family transcriptional regulator [Aestuarium zhoushanense]|jgi:DNA-binding transcriptional MerR regulator|nr:MerR family transcriptional regulator [Aestuarium zhoushanense]
MTQRFVYVLVNLACMVKLSLQIALPSRQRMSETKMNETNNQTMTIREMCDAYDVTPRTLRFYEAKELLFPIRDGQKRLFTKRDRARLKLILRGKRFGFSLEEIRQLLDLYELDDQQETQLVKTYEVAKQHLAEMEQQKAELETAIDDLRQQIEWGRQHLAKLRAERAA